MNSLSQYLALYREQHAALCQGSCAEMNALRPAACERLERLGLPTRRTERYRYTDVAALLAPDYGLNLRRLPLVADPARAYRCQVAGLGARLCYLVGDVPVIPGGSGGAGRTGCSPHGQCAVSGGADGGGPDGQDSESPELISFCQASALEADHPLRRALRTYYGSLSEAGASRTGGASDGGDAASAFAPQAGADALSSLSTLLAQDGLLLRVPEGRQCGGPVQLVCVADGAAPLLSSRRLLVVAEAGSRATLLLCLHSAGRQSHLSQLTAEIVLGAGAELEVYTIDESRGGTALTSVFVRQEAGSRLRWNSTALSAGLARETINVVLAGAGAQAELSGAVVATARQRVDSNLLVVHQAPQCRSQVLYKYVLDGESQGAFAAKAYVCHGASGTVAEQTNANLCVSPQARALAQPMLEIYTDDVQCNHGSTVGKLDEAALFYMQQRGLAESEARLLLQQAFVGDVLQRVRLEPLRERLARLVERRFRSQGEHCEGCSLCK